jgi:hypothetical protein
MKVLVVDASPERERAPATQRIPTIAVDAREPLAAASSTAVESTNVH